MKFPEQFRWQKEGHLYDSKSGDGYGCFEIPGRQANGRALRVIANDGLETGWDHASVSVIGSVKCPSWEEMCIVKNLFWEQDQCVVQFHPPEKDFVRVHPGCLHLWLCVNAEFPMPPQICV